MYDVFRHKAGIENIKAAKAMSAVRTFSATSRAGKIVISALTDMPIATMRALYSGLGASGLIRWTLGMKLGFAMEFSHALGQTAYKGWKQLNQPMRNTMERYGIGKKEWNLVRLKVRQDKGGLYLDPSKITDRDLQSKVIAMFREETRAAVLEPGLREATIFQQLPAGTAAGEIIRSVGVFKSFALTYINSVLFPLINKKTPWKSRVTQAAFIAAVLPIYGWISHAAKQVTAGDIPGDPFEDFESFSKAGGQEGRARSPRGAGLRKAAGEKPGST
jgi:hypothetical protein